MTKKKQKIQDAAELRTNAEKQLATQDAAVSELGARGDAARLVHELQVHQMELEMQNEALREARAETEAVLARFTELYDCAPVGYCTFDQSGVILEANLTAATLVGVERARMIKSQFSLYVEFADRRAVQQFIAAVCAGKPQPPCECWLAANKRPATYIRMQAEETHAGTTCRAAFVDITERKFREDAYVFLLQCGCAVGEDFFGSLAAYLAATLCVECVRIDRLVNDAQEAKPLAIHGYSGFDDTRVYPLGDTPFADTAGRNIFFVPSGVRRLFPRDQVLRDMQAESYVGTTLWSSRGRPLGLISLIGRRAMADSERAQLLLSLVSGRAAGEIDRLMVEEKVQENAAKYRSVIENSADGIYLFDARGIVLEWNRALEVITLLDREHALGRHVWDIYCDFVPLAHRAPAVCEAFREQLLAYIGSDEHHTILVETDIERSDGTVKTIQNHSFCVMLSSLQLFGVIARDITPQKIVEKALQDKNAELERFTYAVSHDLRSPLLTVKTFLGHLERDLLSADQDCIEKDMALMHAAADKMSVLLDEIAQLSRGGHKVDDRVATSLQELVREARIMVAGRIEQRGVQVQVTQEPVLLYGDRVRLCAVFQNLIDNAVKFMGEQPEPIIDIGVKRRNSDVLFFVRDNGMGIDPRHKDDVFGLFVKFNTQFEGSGMGLALVQRIVEAHGGRIWVESDGPGKGACFWFTLPQEQVQS